MAKGQSTLRAIWRNDTYQIWLQYDQRYVSQQVEGKVLPLHTKWHFQSLAYGLFFEINQVPLFTSFIRSIQLNIINRLILLKSTNLDFLSMYQQLYPVSNFIELILMFTQLHFIIISYTIFMKSKAEPCLRDYLTIHVPASTIMGDRYKKNKPHEQIVNPLMNKKLQLTGERACDKVTLVYRTSTNKSFGKRKKIQIIPLLSNVKINKDSKLRVVKDNKNSYNFVFEKPKLFDSQSKDQSKDKRVIQTSQSNNSFQRKKLYSQATKREFLPLRASFQNTYHHNIYETYEGFKTEYSKSRKTQNFPNMEISGYRANLASTPNYPRKSGDIQSYRYYSLERNSHQPPMQIDV